MFLKLALFNVVFYRSWRYLIFRIDSLERVDLEKENFQERMAVKYDSYYIPQIASVLASNKEGDLLGMMYDSGNMPYDALYCIDVGQQRADKVVRLTSGYIAASADLTEKWIVWVEKNQDGWKLYKCERNIGDKILLQEGVYSSDTGPDFPSVDIYGDKLVYDVTFDNGGSITTRIIITDLEQNNIEVLDEIVAEDQYYGAPKIYGDNVVWHKGEWNKRMGAEVFNYNLKEGTIKKLDLGGLNGITPNIWGHFIVVSAYYPGTPENKKILVYDIRKEEIIAEIEGGRNIEFYNPTTSYGIVAWSQNSTEESGSVYVSNSESVEKIVSFAERMTVSDSWITWYNPKNRKGLYLTPLYNTPGMISLSSIIAPKPENQFVVETNYTVKELAQMNPSEITTIRHEAIRTSNYELLDKVVGGTEKEDKKRWMQDVIGADGKKEVGTIKNTNYTVSPHYLLDAKRERATCFVYDGRGKYMRQELTRENGRWVTIIVSN